MYIYTYAYSVGTLITLERFFWLKPFWLKESRVFKLLGTLLSNMTNMANTDWDTDGRPVCYCKNANRPVAGTYKAYTPLDMRFPRVCCSFCGERFLYDDAECTHPMFNPNERFGPTAGAGKATGKGHWSAGSYPSYIGHKGSPILGATNMKGQYGPKGKKGKGKGKGYEGKGDGGNLSTTPDPAAAMLWLKSFLPPDQLLQIAEAAASGGVAPTRVGKSELKKLQEAEKEAVSTYRVAKNNFKMAINKQSELLIAINEHVKVVAQLSNELAEAKDLAIAAQDARVNHENNHDENLTSLAAENTAALWGLTSDTSLFDGLPVGGEPFHPDTESVGDDSQLQRMEDEAARGVRRKASSDLPDQSDNEAFQNTATLQATLANSLCSQQEAIDKVNAKKSPRLGAEATPRGPHG